MQEALVLGLILVWGLQSCASGSHVPSPSPSPDKGWSLPTAQARSFRVLYPTPRELWAFIQPGCWEKQYSQFCVSTSTGTSKGFKPFFLQPRVVSLQECGGGCSAEYSRGPLQTPDTGSFRCTVFSSLVFCPGNSRPLGLPGPSSSALSAPPPPPPGLHHSPTLSQGTERDSVGITAFISYLSGSTAFFCLKNILHVLSYYFSFRNTVFYFL